MRDSALKLGQPSNEAFEDLRVGNELMRDSALKLLGSTISMPVGSVGNELMRDSALKRSRGDARTSTRTPLEMSSCATAL